MSHKRSSRAIHGVLVVDKPRGPTSHDVVAAVRRHFGTRRVGHAGTLDPMATGVLVVLLGEATKLSAHLTRDVKRYVARVSFGAATDTLDAEGRIVRVKTLEPGWLTKDALEAALHYELERTLQIPPVVSAIKVAGRSAHERARRGEEIHLAPREVELHEATVRAWDDQGLEVELLVSKGYYVRAFARDLGEALGVPAHLAALRRTASGPFVDGEALPFPLAENAAPTPLYDVVKRALVTCTLTEEGATRAKDGKQLRPDDLAEHAFPPQEALHLEGVTHDSFPPSDSASRPSSETESEGDDGDDVPSGALLACLYGARVVALATQLPDGNLKVVRGIHDPGAEPSA